MNIEKKFQSIYEKGGLGAVCTAGAKLKKTFRYCPACESLTPAHNNRCLACGQPVAKRRTITDRELNTVLAALRVLQANPALFPKEFRAYKILAKKSLDKLCYEINTGLINL